MKTCRICGIGISDDIDYCQKCAKRVKRRIRTEAAKVPHISAAVLLFLNAGWTVFRRSIITVADDSVLITWLAVTLNFVPGILLLLKRFSALRTAQILIVAGGVLLSLLHMADNCSGCMVAQLLFTFLLTILITAAPSRRQTGICFILLVIYIFLSLTRQEGAFTGGRLSGGEGAGVSIQKRITENREGR